MAKNKHDTLFDPPPDEAKEARLDALADAEIEAGKDIPHAQVAKWLKSWGAPNELPRPPLQRQLGYDFEAGSMSAHSAA